MLRPRWYKVINDLFGNKTRTLLIVLSMAVGLFAIGIILSARTILSDGLASSFAAIHPSSGTIRTVEPFDEDFLEAVRSMPEVQEADARRNVSARVEVAPGEWQNINLFVIADYNDIRVNKVSSESGAWPPPEREILIERAALSVIHAQVGDVIRIKLPNDTQREMRIAGLAYDPAQIPAQIDSTPYGYISFDTLEWLGEPYGFNELYVISTHPEDKVWAQQVVNLVKDRAERSGYTIPLSMTAEPGQLPMDDILQGILLLMGSLGVLSLFLSVFLVINTVSALLAQQKRQIAVMKAIGGGSLQILGMYLVMVISYGILALLIAIPLGTAGARALSQMLAAMFNFNLGTMDVPPQTMLAQIVIDWYCHWPIFPSSPVCGSAPRKHEHVHDRKGPLRQELDRSTALRLEFVVHPQAFHPPVPALDPKHLPQQRTADTDSDHADPGIRHVRQCVQCTVFVEQHHR
jgi:putative ABC transport system permease protein